MRVRKVLRRHPVFVFLWMAFHLSTGLALLVWMDGELMMTIGILYALSSSASVVLGILLGVDPRILDFD